MTAADLTWLDHPWPTFWLADTDALSSPAPAPEAEPEPIYNAAVAAHLAAGGRPIEAAVAATACDFCGATTEEPCTTKSGRVLSHYHVARTGVFA